MDWAASSDELVIQHLNRLQNSNELLLADTRTMTAAPILVERDSAWTDVVDDLVWFAEGRRFTWVSDRDGWNRVYVVTRDGGTVTPVTPPETDVLSVLQVDADGGWVYYVASPENPTQRYLFRAPLDGQGGAERLSPAGEAGTHGYTLAPGAGLAIHTYSRFGTPPRTSLVRLPGHDVVRVLVANDRQRRRVDGLRRGRHEFLRLAADDGTPLDAYQMLPPDFDPAKDYPLLVHVYGEPAGTTVNDAWGGEQYLWHLMLTQRGYVVMSVDPRGTPQPRGRQWRKSVYGAIGVQASADVAAAVRRFVARGYVDPERVAVWGWSGGGSMTLNAMFRYPEVFKVGLSVAPVPDQRLYDTIYQERYMGLPQTNAEGYRQGSPITFAEGLQGDLLIVHGTGDDNVHYQGTERLINRLVELNKPFTMMAYPNRSHGIFEGSGTTRHLFELLTRFLTEHAPPGATE
jgi:dipeptidyl-peptidase-4